MIVLHEAITTYVHLGRSFIPRTTIVQPFFINNRSLLLAKLYTAFIQFVHSNLYTYRSVINYFQEQKCLHTNKSRNILHFGNFIAQLL